MKETQAGHLQATCNPELDPYITEEVTESKGRPWLGSEGGTVVMCQGQGSKVSSVEGHYLYAKGDGHQAGDFTLKWFRKKVLCVELSCKFYIVSKI